MPAEKQDETARLRLWKATDAPDQPMQVRLLPYGQPASKAFSPLQIEEGKYQFSNYIEVPAGPVMVEVSASERPTVVLPMYLAGGGQSTLLVRRLGVNLSAEWIDDTSGSVDNGCEFSIYNLLAASGDVQVVLGDLLTVHLSSTRSSLRLRGIKRGNYPVTITGVDGNGKNFRWDTTADVRQLRRAALLIYSDLYGRIRPRINLG